MHEIMRCAYLITWPFNDWFVTFASWDALAWVVAKNVNGNHMTCVTSQAKWSGLRLVVEWPFHCNGMNG